MFECGAYMRNACVCVGGIDDECACICRGIDEKCVCMCGGIDEE